MAIFKKLSVFPLVQFLQFHFISVIYVRWFVEWVVIRTSPLTSEKQNSVAA